MASTHHATTAADEAVLSKYLLEALGKEHQLETALKAQIAVARRPGVEHALQQHLTVTHRHAAALEQRLDDLGHGNGSAILHPIQTALSITATVANKGLALAKGPLVVLRGTSRSDRELRMIRDCYWNEAEEIAHYRVIEAVAEQVGDRVTADLARSHRADEEQMQTTLEGHLPAVVRGVVADETPRHTASSSRSRKPTAARS